MLIRTISISRPLSVQIRKEGTLRHWRVPSSICFRFGHTLGARAYVLSVSCLVGFGYAKAPWGVCSKGLPVRVVRRRATLPHPLECSTIAAPGLSYRVRNGTGRLTRAMTTAKPRSRNDSQNTWRPFRPLCYEPWRFGNRLADARQSLPLYRSVTIPTHIAVQDDPAQERRGTNPPQEDRNVVSPSPVSTGRLHPSRGFHLRPIKHVFNMRATTVQDRTES